MPTENRPAEQQAVRTTIVGGRPPGSGKPVGNIPRGIEVLLKKAAVDPEFRELLLTKRSVAADAIGLRLDPIEATMLNMAPAEQLALVIGQTRVDPMVRPALLGKVAAAMLLALGLVTGLSSGSNAASASPSGLGNSAAALQADPPAPSAGVQPARPEPPSSQVEGPIDIKIAGLEPEFPAAVAGAMAVPPAGQANGAVEVAGARADVPVGQWGIRPVPPTSQPGATATSQPAAVPLRPLTDTERETVQNLIGQLGSAEFAAREAAYKGLKDMGPVIVPALQAAVKGGMYSPEISGRLGGLIGQLGGGKPDVPDPMIQVRGARPDRPGVNRGLSVE